MSCVFVPKNHGLYSRIRYQIGQGVLLSRREHQRMCHLGHCGELQITQLVFYIFFSQKKNNVKRFVSTGTVGVNEIKSLASRIKICNKLTYSH